MNTAARCVIAGRRAGMATILYAPGPLPEYAHQADFVISHLTQTCNVLAILGGFARV